MLLSVANKSIKGTATTDTIKEKILLLQKENLEREQQARKFVAKDPSKVGGSGCPLLGGSIICDKMQVAQQLEAARLAYELKQQRKAEKDALLKENRKAMLQSYHNIPVLLSMEERAKKHAQKQEQKKTEQQRQQEAREKAEKDREARHMSALLNAKIPEASRRLTKSAAYRTTMV